MNAKRSIAGLLATVLSAAAVGVGAAVAGDDAATLLPERLYDSRVVLAAAQAQPPAPESPRLGEASGAKNRKLAMFYSMLLPGLGEYYLGRTGRAKAFFLAEGAIWTSFAVFRIQGSHRRDLYKEYAELNAGVAPRDDDDFYRIIGNFDGSDGPFSANEQVRRQARAVHPGDREQQEAFFAENAFTGDNAWSWESGEARERFKEMRKSSRDAFHRSELSVGLMVANRLLSILDAGIIAGRGSFGRDQAKLSWDVEVGPEGPGAQVVLSRPF